MTLNSKAKLSSFNISSVLLGSKQAVDPSLEYLGE
jgi:hypothetical protein